ncbi:MAG: hypothetical protein ACFFED_06440 [Candidatus Thorarchaeota archaeon]
MKKRLLENHWFRFILTTSFILLIPYNIDIFATRFSDEFHIRSIFYSFNPYIAPYLLRASFSIISVINLILLIIPSAYFTYRNASRFEGESVEVLGGITIILTLIVAIILDNTAFFSQYLEDVSSTPTPNFDFLPILCMLILFIHVVIPILHGKMAIPTSFNRISSSQFRSRITSKMPCTVGGWILFIIFTIPSLVVFDITTLVLDNTALRTSIQSTFYLLETDFQLGSSYLDWAFKFLIGGSQFLDLMIMISIWNFIFLAGVALYFYEKIPKKYMIFVVLLSFVPSLFISILSIFSVILQISSVLAVPIPLVQLGSLFIIQKAERVKELEKDGTHKDKTSQLIKIPLSYLIRSFFSHRGRRKDMSGEKSALIDNDDTNQRGKTE